MSGALLLAAALVTLLALGVPVAFAIGLSAAAALVAGLDPSPALVTVAQRSVTGLDSFSLLAIPFFVLSGELLNRGGVARRLVAFGKALLGAVPGGLLVVDGLACMLFGSLSGSAVAATAAVGGFLVPRMEKEGYERGTSTALTITASTTGLLIPPSNILIVYALASGGVSVAALFWAGYLPGILVGVLLVLAALWSARRTLPRTREREPLGAATLGALPALALIVLVMGGITLGVFTATEAAAIAVLYSLALCALYRELRWRDLPAAFRDAAATSGVVLLLVATSMAMAWALAFERVPQRVAEALVSFAGGEGDAAGWLVLLLVNLTLLVAGTFLDMTPAVLIFTPLFLPVVLELGFDPVHFGIVMVLNLCIGLCTPPVGTVLFVGLGVGQLRLQQLLPRLLPLYLAMILALVLVTALPEISLWLPRQLGF